MSTPQHRIDPAEHGVGSPTHGGTTAPLEIGLPKIGPPQNRPPQNRPLGRRDVVVGPQPPDAPENEVESKCQTGDSGESFDAAPDGPSWLTLHADDLIERLQQWERELTAKEAQLNTRSSQQDQRERVFRLQAQNEQAEHREQVRAIERMRQQVEAQARRMAFRDL